MTQSNTAGSWTPPMRFLLRKNLIHRLLRYEQLSGKNCLEYGYGAGEMLFLYKQLGLEVYGYDFSESAFAYTNERIENDAAQDSIHLLTTETEVGDRHYDYIMAFEVMEHIEDDVATLKQWCNLLSDQGKIIMSVPAHQRKWGGIDELAGHFRRYEKSTLNSLFASANMEIERLWCYGYPLTIVLDPMLHRWARKRLEHTEETSKIELTKSSSLFTKKSLAMQLLSNDIALCPFYWLQRPLLNTDIGSGYVVMAKKR